MSYQTAIQELINQKSIIQSSDFNERGIPRTYLARLVNSKRLYKVERGIYISDWADFDDFAIAQMQYQTIIYSYTSSLYLHDLIDIIPQNKEVTVYSGYNTHSLPVDFRVHYIKKELYHLGVETVTTSFGNSVVCYDIERTICDLVKNRHKVDIEIYTTALKRYGKLETKNPLKLYHYAKKLGVEEKVQELMEIIYE